jgi:hypothetical protein
MNPAKLNEPGLARQAQSGGGAGTPKNTKANALKFHAKGVFE